MRAVAVLCCLCFPTMAQAWTFTPGLVCKLESENNGTKIELTYNPSQPLYSLSITREDAFANAPVFSMRFIGPVGRVIGTDRHTHSADGKTIRVEDSGFGNVLDGLQFNDIAEAKLGETVFQFSLTGAEEPTAKFRKCERAAGV